MTVQNFIYTFLNKKGDFVMKCLLLALIPLFLKAFAVEVGIRLLVFISILGVSHCQMPVTLEVGYARAMVCITTYPEGSARGFFLSIFGCFNCTCA